MQRLEYVTCYVLCVLYNKAWFTYMFRRHENPSWGFLREHTGQNWRKMAARHYQQKGKKYVVFSSREKEKCGKGSMRNALFQFIESKRTENQDE
ncbi:hypothetical protein M8J76_000725 [Diaphorina citri]|nr:hypothetical protein M8J76_000725 [Diaphorina citri]